MKVTFVCKQYLDINEKTRMVKCEQERRKQQQQLKKILKEPFKCEQSGLLPAMAQLILNTTHALCVSSTLSRSVVFCLYLCLALSVHVFRFVQLSFFLSLSSPYCLCYSPSLSLLISPPCPSLFRSASLSLTEHVSAAFGVTSPDRPPPAVPWIRDENLSLRWN